MAPTVPAAAAARTESKDFQPKIAHFGPLLQHAPAQPSPVYRELTRAEKIAKEKLENPTEDENGEHIQTVEEAKLEA